jgi:hypothetical protein
LASDGTHIPGLFDYRPPQIDTPQASSQSFYTPGARFQRASDAVGRSISKLDSIYAHLTRDPPPPPPSQPLPLSQQLGDRELQNQIAVLQKRLADSLSYPLPEQVPKLTTRPQSTRKKAHEVNSEQPVDAGLAQVLL